MIPQVSSARERTAIAVPPAPTSEAGDVEVQAPSGAVTTRFRCITPPQTFAPLVIRREHRSKAGSASEGQSIRRGEMKWGRSTPQMKTRQCVANAGCIGSRKLLPRQVGVVKVVSVRSPNISFVRRVLSHRAQLWRLSMHANPTFEGSCAQSRAAPSTSRWAFPKEPS